MLLFIFLIVCAFLSGSVSVPVSYRLFIYMYYLPLEIQLARGGVGISLTGLTPPYVCACPKQ